MEELNLILSNNKPLLAVKSEEEDCCCSWCEVVADEDEEKTEVEEDAKNLVAVVEGIGARSLLNNIFDDFFFFSGENYLLNTEIERYKNFEHFEISVFVERKIMNEQINIDEYIKK